MNPFRLAATVALLGVSACGRTEPLLPFEDGGVLLTGSASDAGADAGIDAGVPPPVGCQPGHIALVKATPTVMFVLDRSGSMNSQFGRSTRWQGLTFALSATLPSISADMEIGGLFFPAPGNTRSCGVENATTLLPTFNNVSSLLAQMLLTTPGGQTPTAAALGQAGDVLSGVRAATSARALVLATDGAPNCNDLLNPFSCVCANNTGGGGCRNAQMCLDDQRTVNQIIGLADKGLPTYVIGISEANDSVFIAALNAMAKAGGRPRTGTQSYYGASSEAEIETALVAIRDQVGSCVFLTTSVPDTDGTIAVSVNGEIVPQRDGGTDGWVWGNRANGEIAITGASCESIVKLTTPTVEALVVCSSPDAGR